MWLLLACTGPELDSAPPEPDCRCANVAHVGEPISTELGLLAELAAVREASFPELAGVNVGVEAVVDLQYFRAWTELDTINEAPEARTYTVQYDPEVLSDPPGAEALAAVLAHELGHVLDYLAMDSTELLEFGVWYGSQDSATSDELSAYERATDEVALERGCATGLSAFREWLYARVEGDVEIDKRRNYYSPEEIAAWVEANGSCE